MDFALSPEQRALRRSIINFARAELGDGADDDREMRFSLDGWERCARFGVLGWPIPQEFGGVGLDPLSTVIAMEALGYACRDNGLVFVINNHLWACAVYLQQHGNDEQRKRFLPKMCAGELIGAHALTEEHAGSDILSMRTTVVRDGDEYVLTGTKTFISNAGIADVFVLLARTGEPGRRQDALSAFVVPADSPGLEVTRQWTKSGLRSTPMGEVTLTGCRVPVDNLLGREGDGYSIFTSTIEWERCFMFANQVGVMERILEDCVRHARGREQFGRPVGANQAVSHRIADMKVRLELAKLMIYKVGWLKQQGKIALAEAAIAKLFISESHVQAALDAMQIHGARGYLAEFGVERELRDALGGTIYGGTSEIQREVIASLAGMPGSGRV
ncbi:acyl-CoA dehydrogenase family protein [Micromonospora sp. NPDC049274]|uniref:acyl-CoA dehydrogenase family protein n=1 Tax=Micromonospora sp. NPDC049274 TaxID=3154829 RepID=UPI003427B4BA